MKKIILKKDNIEIGRAIVEDDKAQEMVDIYLDNYKGDEYTTEIVDITQEYNQQKTNEESLKYLTDTDWYIIREYDTGIICPIEIKQLRAEARLKIVK
jgi:hypothetical protein